MTSFALAHGAINLAQEAYYILADIDNFGFKNDVEFAKCLTKEADVAVVPASSFYRSESTGGKNTVRFCFFKKNRNSKSSS